MKEIVISKVDLSYHRLSNILKDYDYQIIKQFDDSIYEIQKDNCHYHAKLFHIENKQHLDDLIERYKLLEHLHDCIYTENVHDCFILTCQKPTYFLVVTDYNYLDTSIEFIDAFKELTQGVQEIRKYDQLVHFINRDNIIYYNGHLGWSLFVEDEHYFPLEDLTEFDYDRCGLYFKNMHQYLSDYYDAIKDKVHNGDVYALGLCMFHLLKNCLPYQCGFDYFDSIGEKERLLLEYCLDSQPKNRFHSLDILQQALDIYSSDLFNKSSLKRLSKEKSLKQHKTILKLSMMNFLKAILVVCLIVVGVFAGKSITKNKDEVEKVQTVEDIYLTKLSPIKKDDVACYPNKELVLANGNTTTNYIKPLSSYSSICYETKNNYSHFKATWSLKDTSHDFQETCNFDIYADGHLVYSSPRILKKDEPIDIDIDIKECYTLTIVFKQYNKHVVLVEPYLYNENVRGVNDKKEDYVLPTFISELDYMHKSGYIYSHDASIQTFRNNTMAHYIEGNTDDEITYYLNGQYEKIKGTWAIKTHKNTLSKHSFCIYADDRLVYTSPEITCWDNDLDFEVDINYCSTITFKFLSGKGYALIGDLLLLPGENSMKANNFNNKLKENSKWLTDLEDYSINHNIKISTNKTKSHLGDPIDSYISGKEEGKITYHLNGKYQYMSGMYSILMKHRNTVDNQSFHIYADDKLVYSSPAINGLSLTVPFNINIENCDDLTIVFDSGDYSNAIYDVQLIKQ